MLVYALIIFGSQLSAGTVNFFSSSVTQGGWHTGVVDTINKFLRDIRFGCRPDGSRGWVQWDGVNMSPTAAAGVDLFRQQIGAPGMIVHVFDESVFNRDSAPGLHVIVERRIERFISVPAGVDRDHLVAQLIIRGVQG